MANLVNLIITGLATGAIYALVAIGFTLLWQTSQTINFAQGDFVMLPAFFMLPMLHAGVPYWLAILIGVILSMLILGYGYKKLLVDPIRKHGVLPLAIAGMALSIFMQEGVKNYTAEAHVFPALIPNLDFHIFGAVVSAQSIAVVVVALAVVIALQWLLNKTLVGHQMQATAQNSTVARLLGIPVERMVLYTFLINGALVAIASALVSPLIFAKFSTGNIMGMAAFTAAIVGGFNQVRGAIAGGLLLGVVNNIGSAYISAQYRDAIPLLLLILVILFRPQGLMGRAEERTV
ncbi:MAG: branched-chain amino acid ABC transporter permease [Hyphomicrobiales bacterium]|nr:branched-chain amino acid ABC transporter permease [Hyphomicrobiales bacterium]MDE2114537.1 branched-chain amino acid ABC transporter permease [Hyphomicrobiales bacterium]